MISIIAIVTTKSLFQLVDIEQSSDQDHITDDCSKKKQPAHTRAKAGNYCCAQNVILAKVMTEYHLSYTLCKRQREQITLKDHMHNHSSDCVDKKKEHMYAIIRVPQKRYPLFSLIGLLLLALFIAGCGGSESAAMNASSPSLANHTSAMVAGASTTNGGQQSSSTGDIGPRYLIKTLAVDMQVQDTRKIAASMQAWIITTDPLATSTATNYQAIDNNQYAVALTFSVQASIYPQIYQYLRDYTVKNGGTLVKFNETVQDVTGTYVDTQSRLQNLRVEQKTVQGLLSQAQNLNDTLTLEQKLSDIEGQIETDEAQLNTLTSQVSFYTITINLEPLDTAAPPEPTSSGWSIGQILHDAFAASLTFGEGLVSFVIWLLAFALYLIPIAIIGWLIRKWYRRTSVRPQPKTALPGHPADE